MSKPFFVIPIPYDVFVAATERCLPGYAGDGWIEFENIHETPKSYTYKLSQYELGDLGNLIIYKETKDKVKVQFTGPPKIDIDDDLYERQKEHLSQVMMVYFQKLYKENIWSKAI